VIEGYLPFSTVQIGALDWCLDVDDRTADEEEAYGVTIGTKSTIRVSPNLPKWKLKDTVLHEIIHAINLTFLPPKDKGVMSEAQVKFMAVALTTVFRANPALARWLVE